jgi:LPXTG-motif cell wall-anchored protein
MTIGEDGTLSWATPDAVNPGTVVAITTSYGRGATTHLEPFDVAADVRAVHLRAELRGGAAAPEDAALPDARGRGRAGERNDAAILVAAGAAVALLLLGGGVVLSRRRRSAPPPAQP